MVSGLHSSAGIRITEGVAVTHFENSEHFE